MITTDTVVVIMSKDPSQPVLQFPAVVTWVLPDGVAFVKPGYLDPYGAPSPQFHRIRGEVSAVGVAGMVAVVKNEDFKAYLWPPSEYTEPSVIEAFRWYQTTLAEQGLDRQAEARELQKSLASSLT